MALGIGRGGALVSAAGTDGGREDLGGRCVVQVHEEDQGGRQSNLSRVVHFDERAPHGRDASE